MNTTQFVAEIRPSKPNSWLRFAQVPQHVAPFFYDLPHGISRHHGDSGPVILCTRESPHAFPHAHSHAHSHTNCTVRHAPSTTARAKLHAVPHGSVTAQAHEQAHARARVVSQRASFLSVVACMACMARMARMAEMHRWHAWHEWHGWHGWHG